MKALAIPHHGTIDDIQILDLDTPSPGEGQVLVRTRAGALNRLDLFVVAGLPGVKLPMPHVLGSDGAGEVAEIGSGVKGFQPGDRVMLNPCIWCDRCEFCRRGEQSLCVRLRLLGEHVAGTLADYFVASAGSLTGIPEEVDYPQAAAFSLVHQTAWRLLITRGCLRPGEDVFIHGIGGGVATASLSIARLAGARVFVSSSDDSKLERARELGATFAFNYEKEDILDQVRTITSKRGVDLVVDSVGEKTWLQSLKMVSKGGRIVTCGATTGPNPRTEIRLIFWKQISILGSTMSNVTEFNRVVKLLGQGQLQPVIDSVLPLEQGREAFSRLSQGKQFGKIVLTMGSGC